jgi:hypothetical protein
MMFATKDTGIIETLTERIQSGVKACIEYTTVVNGTYTNYNIVGLIAVE